MALTLFYFKTETLGLFGLAYFFLGTQTRFFFEAEALFFSTKPLNIFESENALVGVQVLAKSLVEASLLGRDGPVLHHEILECC